MENLCDRSFRDDDRVEDQSVATQARGGRAVILAAAVTLFERVGFHGASVRDIAAEADVTPASIYYHFRSKQEILQVIMVTILGQVIDETQQAVMSAGASPREQLGALVRTWVGFHIDRRAEAFIGNSEIRSLDVEGRARIVALRDEQERLFRSVVETGVADGVFTTSHPREAARAVLNMGRAVVHWYRVEVDGPGAVSPAEMADRYAELALGTVGCASDTISSKLIERSMLISSNADA